VERKNEYGIKLLSKEKFFTIIQVAFVNCKENFSPSWHEERAIERYIVELKRQFEKVKK
jgi:hypothetical protein